MATDPVSDVDRFDESLVEAGLQALRDDAYRTGRRVTRNDLLRTSARLKMNPIEAAALDVEAEAAELLVADSRDLQVAARGSAQGRRVIDALGLWLREIGRYPLLSQKQEIQLARAIESGEEALSVLESGRAIDEPLRLSLKATVEAGREARDIFLCSNLRLVTSIARHHQNRGLELLDLIQEGILGLCRAVDKFDWRLGFKFSTYATHWVRQSIERGIADRGRVIRLPVHRVETIRFLSRETLKLTLKNGKEPTLHELAQHTGIEPATIAYLRDLERDVLSFDRPVADDPYAVTIGELMEDRGESVEQQVEAVELRRALTDALSGLTERERRIVELRFGLDHSKPQTLQEVGDQLHLTRERIRQVEKKALEQLASVVALIDWMREAG